MARLRIEAAPGELGAKAPALVEAFAGQIEQEQPDLARRLRKALDASSDPPIIELGLPALRDLHRRSRQIHAREMAGMIAEIGEVLAKAAAEPLLEKSLSWEEIQALAEDGDELLVSDVPPDEFLVKSKAHKYLARFPTGNAKRPWRYVYAYRKDPYGEAAIAAGKELQPAAKFREHAEAGVGGHWEVVERTNDANGNARSLKIRNDETGEEKSFNSAWEAIAFLHTKHEEPLRVERERRNTIAGGNARKALVVADGYFKAAEEHPSLKSYATALKQWDLFVKQARAAKWTDKEWAEALGVSHEIPKSMKEFRAEYDALSARLRKHRPIGDPFANPDASYWTAKDARRLQFLNERLEYYQSHLDKAWFGEKQWDLPDRKRVHYLNAAEIAHALGTRKATPKTVLDAAKTAAHVKSVADLKHVILIRPGYDGSQKLQAQPELREAIEALAKERGWWQPAPLTRPDSSDDWKVDGAIVQAVDSALPQQLGPESYAAPAAVPWKMPTRADLVAATAKSDRDEDTKKRAAAVLADGTNDPIVSTYFYVPSPRPRMSKKQAGNQPDAAERALKQWKEQGGRTYKSLTLPLSVHAQLNGAEYDAKVAKERKAHAEATKRLQDAIAVVSTKVGPVNAHLEQDAVAVATELGLPAAKAEEFAEKVRGRVRMEAESDVWLQKNEPKPRGISKLTWWFAHEAAKLIDPAGAQLAGDAWKYGVKNSSSPEHEAAHKANAALRAKFERAVTVRVLDRITAALGYKPNAPAAWAKIPAVSPEEARASWGEQRTIKGNKPDLSASHGYDIIGDPADMKRLFDFISPDVAPEARIEVHPKMDRAHCGYDNAVRIEDAKTGWVAWHEFGHAIEHSSTGIIEAANALRDARAGAKGTPKKTMREIDGHDSYEAHEVAYEDQWWSAYIGKWYGKGGSTEVLSMGVQEIMGDPIAFYARDPEHFWFTVAALTGHLGKADKDVHTKSWADVKAKAEAAKTAPALKAASP